MAFVILAFDRDDADAGSRRLAARDAHVTYIEAEAKAGRLALGLPLHDEHAQSRGSMMVLDVPDRDAVRDYLAGEPFARDGVWQRMEAMPFRIAPLPYAPWPTPGSAMPGPRSHTIAVAMDGHDEGAAKRRADRREAHMERIRPFAADGTLLLGGAILDAPDGRMVGSIAVTRHSSHDQAKKFWADDPYVTGQVWQQVAMYGTLLRPLPYKKLPGG